jgi:hypothetical protein
MHEFLEDLTVLPRIRTYSPLNIWGALSPIRNDPEYAYKQKREPIS